MSASHERPKPDHDGRVLVGVDVGGTFTDVVCAYNGHVSIAKVRSQPVSPGRAVLDAITAAVTSAGCDLEDLTRITHGTTVATNAIVQRSGARVGLVTTNGFRDILEIGRMKRWNLYDWQLEAETPTFLAPRERRFVVDERVRSNGEVFTPLDEAEMRQAVTRLVDDHDVEAIAVCFLFSFLNDANERKAYEIIREVAPAVAVSISSEVDPEYREYERTVVTAFDAYVKPTVIRYMDDLRRALDEHDIGERFHIMQSHGGTASPEYSVAHPIGVVKSGPAAGVAAVQHAAISTGEQRLIGLDIGGTSSDVCLVIDGVALTTTEGRIERYPVRAPLVDVQSIGAGGGSIVWIDGGRRLRVGPMSAGADPGPVCYGRGGCEATMTDASLVLGYLSADAFEIENRPLDIAAAEVAVADRAHDAGLSVVELALGAHRIANAAMADQVRLICVKRGYDPREFTLLAFGGAGALHATSIARELEIATVLVPPVAGVFSALGAILANVRHETKSTLLRQIAAVDANEVEDVFLRLTQTCVERMNVEGIAASGYQMTYRAAFRYVGQSTELEVSVGRPFDGDELVASIDSFQDRHRETYGFVSDKARIELVYVAVSAVSSTPPPMLEMLNGLSPPSGHPYAERAVYLKETPTTTPVYRRSDLRVEARYEGPAIVEQFDTTCVVQPDQSFHVDETGNLVIQL